MRRATKRSEELAGAEELERIRKVFQFVQKPKEIARHLSRFVIGQREAKKALSVALCDHYAHVALELSGRRFPFYQKQNILLIGPTGVGKTHLIRSAAEYLRVPFVKADATKFSETGYVGADVEEIVRDLVRVSEPNSELAAYGIVYVDEIDKLATSKGGFVGRDVSGRGVQANLLKLLEDGEVRLFGESRAGGGEKMKNGSSFRTISTRNILFVASGAFSGLPEVVGRRLAREGVRIPKSATVDWFLMRATTADFVAYGLEPEFIGRLPVRVVCHALGEKELYEVLRRSESSLLRQYCHIFGAYGIELDFEDGALRKVAELAAREQMGARGLATVLERIFRDIKFEAPSAGVKRLKISEGVVENPRLALEGWKEAG
ncbi:MAG: AAA family ATPase [Chthoniobacterales bacterium]|nr:AAA family ATPase [Chthoniobacterales bacterium]